MTITNALIMGHKVSTFASHIHSNDTPKPTLICWRAATLAVMVAVASTAKVTAGDAYPSSCCFAGSPSISRQQRRRFPPAPPAPHNEDLSTILSSKAMTSITSLAAAAAVASVVPPPGSRLARWRLLTSGPNGQSTNNRQRKSSESRTDLRYANQPSCPGIRHKTHEAGVKQLRRTIFSSETETDKNMGAISDDRYDQIHKEQLGSPLLKGNDASPKKLYIREKSRKRARMLRFINNRFGRLSSKLGSKKSSKKADEAEKDYQRRKAEWAAKYTSVATLRRTFGSNKNRLWGDFDPETTRQLYHTLLPRALLGLHEMGLMEVDELAPLAYQARVAAKKYARERSMLPGRVASMIYDGFRQWLKYGKFDPRGMTWEQVWTKYEDQVLKEAMEECGLESGFDNDKESSTGNKASISERNMFAFADLDNEELTARICYRILERSVATNKAIDKLFLKPHATNDIDGDSLDETEDQVLPPVVKLRRRTRKQQRQLRRKLRIQADLRAIEKQFDEDIRMLLKGNSIENEGENPKRSFFWSSKAAKAKRASVKNASEVSVGQPSLAFVRGGDDNPSESDIAATMFSIAEFDFDHSDDERTKSDNSEKLVSKSFRKLAVHEVLALRILATTKNRIASLQSSSQLSSGSLKEYEENLSLGAATENIEQIVNDDIRAGEWEPKD